MPLTLTGIPNRKMAQKKAKQATLTLTTKQWPNLPHQLLALLARKPSLMQNITSFGCATKSWRSSSRKCGGGPSGKPRLSQLIQISDKNKHCHTIDIPFHTEISYVWGSKKKELSYRYPASPVQFLGHSHGYIVAMEANLHECCLWKPSEYRLLPRWRYGYYLPPWDSNIPFKTAALSSQWDDPNGCSVMVITGISSPAFAFYRRRVVQKEWILEDCKINDPYALSQHDTQFTNAIGFKGKFYALSLQGSLVVVEQVDSYFRITAIGASRVVPSKVSRQFREFLVESDGEILLVFLVSRKSINIVEDVEVFRLDVVELLWVKLEKLGDRALFLEDECCMAVTASKVRCRRNCIYFTHDRVNEWHLYELERCQISPAFDIKLSLRWDEQAEQLGE